MDLFSINYIHFGAPKFWYAIPQGRAAALEQTMRGYFPKDTTNCPQFLRHKSFLASPTLLAQSSCRPNFLVQQTGEFVITFPRGYHAGFNLGFNCAESVNFALDSWLDLGRRAKACECVSDSVRIDVDQLLLDRAAEAANPPPTPKPKRSSFKKENDTARAKTARKRKAIKAEEFAEDVPPAKKLKIRLGPPKPPPTSDVLLPLPKASFPRLSITLKLGPRPAAPEPFPCCLCVSMERDGLLRVHDPPIRRKDAEEAAGNPKVWMAHEMCANIVPETWVDEIENAPGQIREKVVYGVDAIVKDRWQLKCSACTKSRPKAHGAPIQCTKGKCSKAFHVSCAQAGSETGIVFTVLREVEKEVVLLEPTLPALPLSLGASGVANAMEVDPSAPVDRMSEPPSSRVLKSIKKLEVQVLCSQHNPAVAAAKKEAKQDKIKAELLALPPMARIKIRVSSGVFEVSLLSVIEATKSVEVLWDKGDKKEFKWTSVIFGSTDGPVLQKPSELEPKPEPIPLGLPVPTYSSVGAAAASRTPQAQAGSSSKPTHLYTAANPYAYPARAGTYNYWQYQNPSYAVYPAYYPAAGTTTAPAAGVAGPSHYAYAAYAHAQTQYQPSQYHWQPPYQGQMPPYTHAVQSQPAQPQPNPPQPNKAAASNEDPQPQVPADDPSAPPQPPPVPTTEALSPEVQEGLYKNLAALSALQPEQFKDMLRDNPQLRDVVMAAVGEALPPATTNS
ncbi:hypothetical protein H0H81_009712 [Sphagnurus paluster]|uniref:[Histone H3]-trimethyl-L-lysine(9) demethylase n=1 Tax=Sphagnurus paluster TaxID=117069 RepID=A0A9P7GNJ4_9AGAR|nr:hypothetical protein H0H81_009712 [Sphagnurus paluster]